MPECEICGRQVETVYEIDVEGAQMLVCEADARGKNVLHRFDARENKKQQESTVKSKAEEGEEEIVENYGEEIRRAREKLGLPLKVLAEKISEKESTLVRVEKQETLPSEKTRIKLEKELGIKLITRAPAGGKAPSAKRSEPVTLWDIAKDEDKEQGE